MKRDIKIQITRDRDNNAFIIGDRPKDEAIENELTQMFIEYDDVTIKGVEIDTDSGCRLKITWVINNVNNMELTDDELASAYYHAFAPFSIMI